MGGELNGNEEPSRSIAEPEAEEVLMSRGLGLRVRRGLPSLPYTVAFPSSYDLSSESSLVTSESAPSEEGEWI